MESISKSEYGSKDVTWDWVNTKLPQVIGSFIMIKKFKYYYNLWEIHGGDMCPSVSEQQTEVGL